MQGYTRFLGDLKLQWIGARRGCLVSLGCRGTGYGRTKLFPDQRPLWHLQHNAARALLIAQFAVADGGHATAVDAVADLHLLIAAV